jgi:hypothetical protein
MLAGAIRFERNFPAVTSNEKMRSFTSHANGSEVFEAGKKREMRGTRVPNAAAPLDVRKVLRSMQIIGGFHSPAERRKKMSGTYASQSGSYCDCMESAFLVNDRRANYR